MCIAMTRISMLSVELKVVLHRLRSSIHFILICTESIDTCLKQEVSHLKLLRWMAWMTWMTIYHAGVPDTGNTNGEPIIL